MEKIKKAIAPPKVTFLMEIFLANNFPPRQAAAVQMKWPTIAPRITNQYSEPAAIAIVAI